MVAPKFSFKSTHGRSREIQLVRHIIGKTRRNKKIKCLEKNEEILQS